MTLQSTLDAIRILETAYEQSLRDGTPSVVRQIIIRSQGVLRMDARRLLTGQSDYEARATAEAEAADFHSAAVVEGPPR